MPRFLLFLLLSILICIDPAQTTASGLSAADGNGNPPKIGLVLSGGGARGAAHIGVLRVLEEYRVRVSRATES